MAAGRDKWQLDKWQNEMEVPFVAAKRAQIFAKTLKQVDAIKALLNKEHDMKDLGRAQYILGIRIRREGKKIYSGSVKLHSNFSR